MGALDRLGDILGDLARGAGNILSQTLPQAIPAGLQYLTAREQSSAARDMAKSASGAQGPVRAVQRLQQAQGGRSMSFMPRSNGNGNGVGNVLAQLGITGTPPYQQASVADDLLGLPSGSIGGALGSVIPFVGGGQPQRMGGIPIASDLYGFYTESGNPRKHVVSIAGDRADFWTRRGRPLVFSGDAKICRDVKKYAGAAYRASGGCTSARKR